MSNERRKIEIFSAGCPACTEAVDLVNQIADPSCEVSVLDMHQANVTAKAKQYGVGSVPAVAVDGKLPDCCTRGGLDEATLLSLGIGGPRT